MRLPKLPHIRTKKWRLLRQALRRQVFKAFQPANQCVVRRHTQSGFYAQPAKHSVLFLHNSYYHFYYLAQALRRRGWDALLVCTENPDSSDSLFYHGEDLNLYHPDPVQFGLNLAYLTQLATERYGWVHFANDVNGMRQEPFQAQPPAEFITWKNAGVRLAYTITGCNSGITQTALAHWSRQGLGFSVCDKCKWQNRPDVCHDDRSRHWKQLMETYADIIFAEGLPALDLHQCGHSVREPVTMVLDPVLWRPNLPIPPEFTEAKQPDELLIYHGMGNYQLRTREDGVNIKGTPHIVRAVEQLQAEGYPVRFIFRSHMWNKHVRYIQAQADVIVDQLNLGRYGATAREGMMLGKPVICCINPYEANPKDILHSLTEAPLVHATEETIYAVLKALLDDPAQRRALGEAGRHYALKWHSADSGAMRYEALLNQVASGQALQHPPTWEYTEPTIRTATLAQTV